MTAVPLNREKVNKIVADNKIKSVGKASIREVKKIIDDIEKAMNIRFVRMEMGVPGLPTVKQGVDAQIQALKDGVSAIYPDIYGTAELKHETTRFVKNFLRSSRRFLHSSNRFYAGNIRSFYDCCTYGRKEK